MYLLLGISNVLKAKINMKLEGKSSTGKNKSDPTIISDVNINQILIVICFK